MLWMYLLLRYFHDGSNHRCNDKHVGWDWPFFQKKQNTHTIKFFSKPTKSKENKIQMSAMDISAVTDVESSFLEGETLTEKVFEEKHYTLVFVRKEKSKEILLGLKVGPHPILSLSTSSVPEHHDISLHIVHHPIPLILRISPSVPQHLFYYSTFHASFGSYEGLERENGMDLVERLNPERQWKKLQ